METSLKISFQGGDASDALRQMVVEHVEALEQLHGRLTACHVVIKVPDKRHRTGNLYAAHIHMTWTGLHEEGRCDSTIAPMRAAGLRLH